MLAIATLLVVVLLSLLVTRVGEVAFTLTGLSPDVAKFQARSMFSSTGLGIAESEAIARHPARRRIAMTLMLLGNAGLVTTIASLSVALTEDRPGHTALTQVSMLVAGLAVVLMLARSQSFYRASARIIEGVLRRYADLDVRDYHGFLHLANDYAIDRVAVSEDHWLADRNLAASRLSEEGILVLGIERKNGLYIGAPTGATKVEPGDQVLVYGSAPFLRDLKSRPAGVEGTEAHMTNVDANSERVAAERSLDHSHRWRDRFFTRRRGTPSTVSGDSPTAEARHRE